MRKNGPCKDLHEVRLLTMSAENFQNGVANILPSSSFLRTLPFFIKRGILKRYTTKSTFQLELFRVSYNLLSDLIKLSLQALHFRVVFHCAASRQGTVQHLGLIASNTTDFYPKGPASHASTPATRCDATARGA